MKYVRRDGILDEPLLTVCDGEDLSGTVAIGKELTQSDAGVDVMKTHLVQTRGFFCNIPLNVLKIFLHLECN